MSKNRNFKDSLVRAMELPEDLAYQEPVVTLTGARSLQVENYRNLVRCQDQEIVIHTTHGLLIVSGCHLVITDYTAEEMHITGKIASIKVEGR